MWDLLWGVVGLPLKYFYKTGPTWAGGWQSKENADICAEITKVPSQFWELNNQQCTDAIDKHFLSIYALVKIIIYGLLLYKVFSVYFFRYTVVFPLERALGKLLERNLLCERGNLLERSAGNLLERSAGNLLDRGNLTERSTYEGNLGRKQVPTSPRRPT